MTVVHIFKGDFRVKVLKEERGFSLIEVVIAIVIIGITLISFSQLFLQSNRVATFNNEKLVVINLANAELERLKLTSQENIFGTSPSTFNKPGDTFKNYIPKTVIKKTNINSIEYEVKITASQQKEEHFSKLLNIQVQVIGPNNKSKSVVEGYLTYE